MICYGPVNPTVFQAKIMSHHDELIFTKSRMNKNFIWCTLTTVIATVLAAPSAEAAQLVDWRFNTSRNVIGLTTSGAVKPSVFLLSNPNRLVIDLPGTAKKGPTIREQYGGAVREIRISQIGGSTTRAVIELANGYGVSAKNIKVASDSPKKWYVRLKSIESGIPPGPGETKEVIPVPTEGADVPAAPPIDPPSSPSSPSSGRPVPRNILASLPKGRELTGLRSQLKSLMADYSFLSPGIFFIDVETGDYVDIAGSKVFPAASTIKLPILLALFEAVDAGRVRLDETLVVTNATIASGSGNLQYYRGAKLSVLATATKMITISDNTATNMIVKRLGGLAAVNARFRSWGLETTYMRNYMGDFRGTNKTSALDLVKVSALIAKRMIITPESRQKVLDILNATENRKLLWAGLGRGANIAHKTGDIGFVIGDAGIIEKPSGKLYLAGVFVRRPYNDTRGRDFVQKVSRITYNYFNSSASAELPPLVPGPDPDEQRELDYPTNPTGQSAEWMPLLPGVVRDEERDHNDPAK
jgi:beta-lactamase class A